MLRDEIKKGVKIAGLFDLISKGADPFDGSWTLTKNLMSSNVITFYGNTSGKKGVRILPYKRGENSSTPMTGVEVISGSRKTPGRSRRAPPAFSSTTSTRQRASCRSTSTA